MGQCTNALACLSRPVAAGVPPPRLPRHACRPQAPWSHSLTSPSVQQQQSAEPRIQDSHCPAPIQSGMSLVWQNLAMCSPPSHDLGPLAARPHFPSEGRGAVPQRRAGRARHGGSQQQLIGNNHSAPLTSKSLCGEVPEPPPGSKVPALDPP